MSADAHLLRKQVVDRVLNGTGATSTDARRAAFDNTGGNAAMRELIDTVSRNAWKVTDAQVKAVQTAGASDDEIFELVVSAALGQSTRQLDAALRSLDEVLPPGTKENK